MKKICFWFLALCPVILCAGESFFEDGNTVWAVDTENSAHETIRYAERELKNALFKISGVKFPSSGTAEHRIVLKVDPAMPADRISIRTRDGKLLLSGGSERSVLYAVYTFLQKYLGVRWLWPGASGEFMPRKERWTLPEIDFSYQPPIKYRALHQTGDAPADKEGFRDWMARNFSTNHWNGVKNDRKDRARGFYVAWGAHAACVPQRYFRQHPEYFALTNGIRHNMQSLETIDTYFGSQNRNLKQILSSFYLDSLSHNGSLAEPGTLCRQLFAEGPLTESMEDYLEMIYRLTQGSHSINVKKIAQRLNVKPPSVSKMMNRLKELDLVIFERYGTILLTWKGKRIGKYLLWRHQIVMRFFKWLNKKEYRLEQVEKVEHFLDDTTLRNMAKFLEKE